MNNTIYNLEYVICSNFLCFFFFLSTHCHRDHHQANPSPLSFSTKIFFRSFFALSFSLLFFFLSSHLVV